MPQLIDGQPLSVARMYLGSTYEWGGLSSAGSTAPGSSTSPTASPGGSCRAMPGSRRRRGFGRRRRGASGRPRHLRRRRACRSRRVLARRRPDPPRDRPRCPRRRRRGRADRAARVPAQARPALRIEGARDHLAWANATSDGRAWLASLPELVERCAEQWSLQVGEAFPYASTALVLPATTADGEEAVLKIGFLPSRERARGRRARLLGRQRRRSAPGARPGRARRCSSSAAGRGRDLSAVGPKRRWRCSSTCSRLGVQAGAPFRPLAEEADWGASRCRGSGTRQGARLSALCSMPRSARSGSSPTPRASRFCSTRDHAGNVLAAAREPWLAIDPKPLAGEREFGLAPVLRDDALGTGKAALRPRFDRLTGELGLDRERVRGWAIAQTLGWAFEGHLTLFGACRDRPSTPALEIIDFRPGPN